MRPVSALGGRPRITSISRTASSEAGFSGCRCPDRQ
jgi:hypothetical protein